ncbi:MAG: hypothetical protein RSB54_01300, partial [Bacilli bacterium]
MLEKKDVLFLYCLISIELLILSHSEIAVNSVINSINIFKISVLPALFPTMLIASLLIKNNVCLLIPNFICTFFKKTFNFNKACTSIFILSMISGSPSNAKFIEEYLNNGLINEKQAESLLCCTHFINPLFVVFTVGIGVFNAKIIGIIIIIIMFILNLINAFILRKNFLSKEKEQIIYQKEPFIKQLQSSINSSFYTLGIILGVIMTFQIISSLIISIFNLNTFLKIILMGTLEITGGIVLLSKLTINIWLKFIIALAMLIFGGFSIHLQTFSILSKRKIR